MTHTGQCLCGQVRVAISTEPVGARQCWCRDCQYIANGSATVNAVFPPDAVHFTGEFSKFHRVAASGNTVERGFCPTCGTHLYSATLVDPAPPIRIRVGTLDNPGAFPPQVIIWTASAPAWAKFDPDLPQFPGAPPPTK